MFENMVAAELWRAVNLWTDIGHGSFTLHFVKNKEKQEVDFLRIPAVQLTGSVESYRLINNEGNKIHV